MNSDGCIEWDKCRNKNGYGRVMRQGKEWKAHRLAWFKAHGEIPKGICVLHRCDNPPCINVEHLFLGTQKDNVQDMFSKGRQGRSKLTEKDVLEVRGLIAQGVVQARIAEQFGVSPAAISDIKLGRRWEYLD